MRNKLDLKFCDFYYDANKEKNINKIIFLIKNAYFKNKKFYNKTIKKFKLIFVYSRKELNKFWKRKTQKWCIAFATKTKIYIFSPQILEKISIHKKEAFYNTLIHEINHLFYQNIFKTYKPLWLSEGLALNLETDKNQTKLSLNPKSLYHIKLSFSFISKKYNRKVGEISFLNYLIVKYLLREYNKLRLFNLLSLYSKCPKKIRFIKLFNQIYKFPFSTLTRTALKYFNF